MDGDVGVWTTCLVGIDVRLYQRLIGSKEWSDVRELVIKRDGCCVVCGSKDNLQVHHRRVIKPLELCFFEMDNLSTVCASCHEFITRELRLRHGHKKKRKR